MAFSVRPQVEKIENWFDFSVSYTIPNSCTTLEAWSKNLILKWDLWVSVAVWLPSHVIFHKRKILILHSLPSFTAVVDKIRQE